MPLLLLMKLQRAAFDDEGDDTIAADHEGEKMPK
jgi:hypothetical protein